MEGERNHRSIESWRNIFSGLYSEIDSKRTPEQMWIAIMAHSSSIGESIRKDSFLEMLKFAAHTFCWLCSFVNYCNKRAGIFSCAESLSGIICFKYPLACGHCKDSRCSCDPEKIDAAKDKAADYEDLLRRRKGVIKSDAEYSIADWIEKFKLIYGGRVHILTLESIGFHFLEEVGEGAIAVRKLGQLQRIVERGIRGIDEHFLKRLTTVDEIVEQYKQNYRPEIDYTSEDPAMLKWRIADAKMSMVVEIADTVSWLCALMNKLDSISKYSGFKLPSLEKKLVEEYIDENGNAKCATCNKKPCSCIFFP